MEQSYSNIDKRVPSSNPAATFEQGGEVENEELKVTNDE
jgi:hypothetical protein